jgi:hypothetical protein
MKQLAQWKEVFVSHSLNKGLISNIYKELQKLNTKRSNIPINAWANEQFSQQEVQFTNKYI